MHASNPLRKIASHISNGLTRFPRLHHQLRQLFLQLPAQLRGPVIVHDSLQRLASRNQSVFFLQIGANDGDQSDPLRHFVHKSGWRGILVEPVPLYYNALKTNYAESEGLIFENIAISDTAGHQEFHYLEDPAGDLPEWARGLGSFYLDEVTSAQIPGRDANDYLKTIRVPCLTVSELLERHCHPDINLLIIDAQGFDGRIIKQLDFNELTPEVVVFEHILLDPDEKQDCCKRLESAGYLLLQDQWDVVATKRSQSIQAC
jgi:FkbM family methyltransferase